MGFGQAVGNSQAQGAGGSGEPMSGEEAEQNELADYSSPYGGQENDNMRQRASQKN